LTWFKFFYLAAVTIKPTLRYFDLTMIVISMVIGIGIFRNPSIIAQSAGTPSIFFLAWITGGTISLVGALTFAEIGSRLPQAGGFYKTFAFCYPPPIAFTLIWTYLMLNAGAMSAVAYAGAQYITPVLFPSSLNNEAGRKIMFFIIIGILFFLNYAGIKSGSRTQNVLSSIKIVLMLIFCSAILFAKPSDGNATVIAQSVTKNFWLALGTSLIPVFFTFGGYQNTGNLGGDVKETKNISRAIITATTLILALYLLINFVYVSLLGFEGVKNSPLIAADLSKLLFGDAGARIASVAIFISILGILNASLMFNPRVFYAMAEEGILPKIFMKTNEKNQVQEFSLMFFTFIIVFFFIILQTYENLLNYVEFNDTIVLAAAAACIFFLRKKQKDYSGFRIFFYPWLPVIFILITLYVTASVTISDPKNAGIGFLVLISGLPFYYLLKLLRRNR